MISFKQYLTEVRAANLYHGTSSADAAKILQSNVLKGHKSDWLTNTPSVSLTRSEEYARIYANKERDIPLSDIIVFELDRDKLKQRYKVSPFNLYSERSARVLRSKTDYTDVEDDNINEFEERVVGDIKNINQYIVKIITYVKPGKPIAGNLILSHPKLFYNGKFVNK